MSTRGNIFFTEQHIGTDGKLAGIYLYSHYDGDTLPDRLKAALRAARPRWTDPTYCTRIIVDQITKPGRDKETGFGLSTYLTDYNVDTLVVDLEHQTVSLCTPGQEGDPFVAWKYTQSFEDFVGE